MECYFREDTIYLVQQEDVLGLYDSFRIAILYIYIGKKLFENYTKDYGNTVNVVVLVGIIILCSVRKKIFHYLNGMFKAL